MQEIINIKGCGAAPPLAGLESSLGNDEQCTVPMFLYHEAAHL